MLILALRRTSYRSTIHLLLLLTWLICLSEWASADIIYGTSNGNIVSYNTQTQVTATINTTLGPLTSGIAFGPDGNLYIVERNPSAPATENIEVYSTGGVHIKTFLADLPAGAAKGDGLAFSPQGDLFLTTRDPLGNPAVAKFAAGGGTSYLPAPAGGFVAPYQLAWGGQTLYVSDPGADAWYSYSSLSSAPFTNSDLGVTGVATSGFILYLSHAIYIEQLGKGPLPNPLSNQGATGLAYSPVANLLFGVSAPSLIQYDVFGTYNPDGNFHQVSSGFINTEFLTVQAVPEPGSVALAAFAVLGLVAVAWRCRR